MEHQFETIPDLELNVKDTGATLELTQKIRLKAVNQLTRGGTVIPDDPKDLITFLRHMDDAALTTRKLDIEQQNGEKGTQALLDAFDMLMTGNTRPKDISKVSDRIDPTRNLALPAPDLVPGEDVDFEQKLNVGDFLPDEE